MKQRVLFHLDVTGRFLLDGLMIIILMYSITPSLQNPPIRSFRCLMCAFSLRADLLFCMVLCYMLPTLSTYVVRMRVTVVNGVKLKLKGLSWEFTRTQAYGPRTVYAEAWWKEKWLWTDHLKPWIGNLQLLATCSNDKSFYIPYHKHYSRFLCNIPKL